jgi:hypothetical protein
MKMPIIFPWKKMKKNSRRTKKTKNLLKLSDPRTLHQLLNKDNQEHRNGKQQTMGQKRKARSQLGVNRTSQPQLKKKLSHV